MDVRTTQDLRRVNKEKILNALYELGQCNKMQIADYTSLSLGTCNNILKDLLTSKEVTTGEVYKSTGGRKAIGYKLNKDYAQIMTISFHRECHTIYYVLKVYNLIDEVLYEKTSKSHVIDFERLCKDITEVMKVYKKITVISLSLPAVILDSGYIDEITLVDGLEGLRGICISSELRKQFKVKVLLENDVNIAAVGYQTTDKEASLIGWIYQPSDDIAGGALIVDGKLYKGKHHFVGEFPFIPFLSKQEQFIELKTKEGTIQLLAKLTMTMIVMNDPEIICICCQNIKDDSKLKKEIQKYLPYENIMPKLIFIEDIYQYIFKGLLKISHDAFHIKEQEEKNNGKIY